MCNKPANDMAGNARASRAEAPPLWAPRAWRLVRLAETGQQQPSYTNQIGERAFFASPARGIRLTLVKHTPATSRY